LDVFCAASNRPGSKADRGRGEKTEDGDINTAGEGMRGKRKKKAAYWAVVLLVITPTCGQKSISTKTKTTEPAVVVMTVISIYR
jgi:hypothetical protein